MHLSAFVCLSVCEQVYSNTWIDLDEILRVDIETFDPDPEYSPDAATGLLFPVWYVLQC